MRLPRQNCTDKTSLLNLKNHQLGSIGCLPLFSKVQVSFPKGGGCFAQAGEIKAADGGWLLVGLALMGLALAGRRRRMT